MINDTVFAALGLFSCGVIMGAGFIAGAHVAIRWLCRRAELVPFKAEWRERS